MRILMCGALPPTPGTRYVALGVLFLGFSRGLGEVSARVRLVVFSLVSAVRPWCLGRWRCLCGYAWYVFSNVFRVC